jgi:hypothetical protein
MKLVSSIRSLSLVLVSLAACAATPAAANPPITPAPEAPAADPIARAATLVGNWEGDGTFVLNGKALAPHATMQCTRAGSGSSVACQWAIFTSDGFRLEEQELIGYDKASDTYHLFSVNNFGEAYDHAGKWDANGAALDYRSMRDGKEFREQYRFEVTSPTEVRSIGTDTLDGQMFAQGTLTLRKTS